MGTKRQPGRFDCYAKAEPDEPMFVLLARDPDAPFLVELWARIKDSLRVDTKDKIQEAMATAASMRRWREDHQ